MQNGNQQLNVIEVLRVSTDHQDMARQRYDLDYLKKRDGLQVVRTLELQGISGTKTYDHEDMLRMLGDLKDPSIKGVSVSALDRLFRIGSDYRQWSIVQAFAEHAKCIWSAREGFIDPLSDEGYDRLIAAAGRSGSELRELMRRSMGGRRRKLAQGQLVSGSAPYGYQYLSKHKGGPALVVIPEEAEVVRQVFAWRRNGMAVYAIASRLNQLGVRSKGYNGKPGGNWSRVTVQQLLAKRAFIGEYVTTLRMPNRRIEEAERFVVPVPQIVERDVWEAAQAMAQESRLRHIGRPSRKYLLRGLLFCRKCGRRCNAQSSKAVVNAAGERRSYPHYICGNVNRRGGWKRNCDSPHIRCQRIETAAWAAVWDLLCSPAQLLKQARAYYAALSGGDDTVEKVQAQRDRLQKKLERARRMMVDGMLPYNEGGRIIRETTAAIDEANQKLRATGKVGSIPPLDVATAAVAEIMDPDSEPDDYEGRRSVLDGLVNLRMTYGPGELLIEGAVPMPIESIESKPKKCKRAQYGPGISFDPIPFKLTVSLAA